MLNRKITYDALLIERVPLFCSYDASSDPKLVMQWPLYTRDVSNCIVKPFQGPVSRKSRKVFGPEKPFVKLRPANSVKLVFSYVVKGIKIKITAKFRASRRLSFEDTKRIMSPEMRPKSLGTFEKQATDPVRFLDHQKCGTGPVL